MNNKLKVVAIGGTQRPNSSTEKILRQVAAKIEEHGAECEIFAGECLEIPLFSPKTNDRCTGIVSLLEAVRRADGIILASPGYHGTISGAVKNVIDYLEDLAADARPYLDGRPVGCIATGAGWQGANQTLTALRAVTHSLRGWPTPVGIAANTVELSAQNGANCASAQSALDSQACIMAEQMVAFMRTSQLAN